MKNALQVWLGTGLGLLVACHIITGVRYETIPALIAASLVLALLNSVVRPILVFFTLPFVILSLGLFLLILNAFLLWLTGIFVQDFKVESFWSALGASLIISVINMFLGLAQKKKSSKKYPPQAKSFKTDISSPSPPSKKNQDIIDI